MRSTACPSRHALTTGLAVAALVVAFDGLAAAQRTSPPVPGPSGVGDRLFPQLGNGGYDVVRYELDVEYAGPELVDVTADVGIRAEAERRLPRFNLDFAGGSVERVAVDGVAAEWDREDEELVVWPARDVRRGRTFRVDVAYTPDPPQAIDAGVLEIIPWMRTADGSVTAAQPDGAHWIFPSNDHPSDKAAYRIRLTVPDGITAVANGTLERRTTTGGRTTWTYEHRRPMASELIQLAVGDLEVRDGGQAAGVPLRHVLARAVADPEEPILSRVPVHMAFMTERVGPYPFDVFGALGADADIGFALETQTLPLYPAGFLLNAPPRFVEPTMVHELAHEWFGNSVSPATWSDLWLNEAHATWYERQYEFETFPNVPGRPFQTMEEFMRAVYALGDQWRADFGPVARQRSGELLEFFNPNVYEGGALVLYALRQEVGDATFRRIEREWARRNQYGVVGTLDFIRFASRIARRDLRPFLRAWVYRTTTPPMPGHPDWTVDPVEAQPTAASRAVVRQARLARALHRP